MKIIKKSKEEAVFKLLNYFDRECSPEIFSHYKTVVYYEDEKGNKITDEKIIEDYEKQNLNNK